MHTHILTLNWQGIDKLKELEPGLIKSMEKLGNATWYVRDNGSKDGSVKWLKDRSHIKLLEINNNRANFSTGVNSLYELANPNPEDLILFLNNDVVIKNTDSINRMVNLLLKTKAEIVGARLLFKGTDRLQHAGIIFSEAYNSLPYHFRPGDQSDKAATKNRWFQAVTGACLLTTAKAFQRVGGLNSRYNWSFEDVSYNLSVISTSTTCKKVAYCGETEIYHEESASLKKNPVNKMFMQNNVIRFRQDWTGKYEIDHQKYLKDIKYNEIS